MRETRGAPGLLEAAVLDTLASGPAPTWALALAGGRSVRQVEPILRELRARGLVVVEESTDGVRRWRLAGEQAR